MTDLEALDVLGHSLAALAVEAKKPAPVRSRM